MVKSTVAIFGPRVQFSAGACNRCTYTRDDVDVVSVVAVAIVRVVCVHFSTRISIVTASIAQLGERKTEDLEAPCSIHGRSTRKKCRDGLVGYDAALTQLRSWVRFPFLVLCASGLVVKSNVAIVGPRVRFSAGAFFFSG